MDARNPTPLIEDDEQRLWIRASAQHPLPWLSRRRHMPTSDAAASSQWWSFNSSRQATAPDRPAITSQTPLLRHRSATGRPRAAGRWTCLERIAVVGQGSERSTKQSQRAKPAKATVARRFRLSVVSRVAVGSLGRASIVYLRTTVAHGMPSCRPWRGGLAHASATTPVRWDHGECARVG